MLSKKRKTRELAMQVLFVWDTNATNDAELGRQIVTEGSPDDDVRRQALEWAGGAWEQREIADLRVERLAPQWPPRRQPAVDRNILRLAVWELTNTQTPPKVVLDEAIELAKHFSTEQSASFVNGVLDAVLREHRALVEGPAFGVQGSEAERAAAQHSYDARSSDQSEPAPSDSPEPHSTEP